MNHLVEYKTVKKDLPIFSSDISQHKQILSLAVEAILEEKSKNPKGMESNVKAYYVSDYSSHLSNPKFQPLIDLVLSLAKFVSKDYFNCNFNLKVYNCWGMIYEEGDHAVKHTHFPSTFSAVVYIDIEESAAPIIFEDQLSIVPTAGSVILFPAILSHEVPKTKGKRIVVAMNIENDI